MVETAHLLFQHASSLSDNGHMAAGIKTTCESPCSEVWPGYKADCFPEDFPVDLPTLDGLPLDSSETNTFYLVYAVVFLMFCLLLAPKPNHNRYVGLPFIYMGTKERLEVEI